PATTSLGGFAALGDPPLRSSHGRLQRPAAVGNGWVTLGGPLAASRACGHPLGRAAVLPGSEENAYRVSSVCLRNGRPLLNATKSRAGMWKPRDGLDPSRGGVFIWEVREARHR